MPVWVYAATLVLVVVICYFLLKKFFSNTALPATTGEGQELKIQEIDYKTTNPEEEAEEIYTSFNPTDGEAEEIHTSFNPTDEKPGLEDNPEDLIKEIVFPQKEGKQKSQDYLYQNQKGGTKMDPEIKVPVLIGEGTIQKMVESTVTLASPAVKIREIRATMENLRTDVIPGKVIIQGTLHKQIFYVGEDTVIHHQTELIPISYFLDITGAAPGMDVTVTSAVEHVTYNLLNPTTLHQKVILAFSAVVTQTQILNVVAGIGTPLYYVPQVMGTGSQQLIAETTVTLANAAQKVDEITAVVRDITTDVITDKVIIQGILHKQIFYVGVDNVEYHQAEDVPFSLFVDVTGAGPGMNVQVHPTIEAINYTLENETTLLQKVVIMFEVVVTQNVQINLVEGTGPVVVVPEVAGEATGQTLLQDIVTMERPTQKIRNIDASVTSITGNVIANKVIIQGTVHKQIFYIGTDNIEYEQSEDVDFSFFVDVTGAVPGMSVVLVPTIESVIPELLSETQMLEKVVLQVLAKVTTTVRLAVTQVQLPV
ncbi:MAG: hypothetical protein PWR06_1281 [Thermoanaerobacteraceae bacterium]|jgi:ribosome biogenesis SPOUT family RNA methylase Rps3|nr:hypothetical protein [Thermoanaerobacteraceae bacterium]MDN5301584.1 hypothetical protein [Thermoanaerobacteraceae bacterium]MDN5312117.1 hypothetical protein [Thermoanaerobacteraceae bacterium]RKL64602.1 DUF3794 domain-containing protein [Thermoanaerobacteraceae bacterium SP2]